MKNPGKSIRTRLLKIARKEGLAFQLIIIRYMHERLLYRLSLSHFSANFCLKGGVLLYAYSGELTRPTKDIDFLGANIPNEINFLKDAFTEICSINVPDDAVTFDIDSIEAEEIAGQDEYSGIRLFINVFLDTINQRIQIDTGFGDAVTLPPIELSYPVLLPGSETPVIKAYSLETVVAEKFEAMIDLSTANSRMKDFYDVYQILTTRQLNRDHLGAAIRETFRTRDTHFTADHSLLSPSFTNNPSRIRHWKAFLSKNHLNTNLEFSSVIEGILHALSDIISHYLQ